MTLTFDLITADAPLTLGPDIQQYSQRNFMTPEATINFQRTLDNAPALFPIYVRNKSLLRHAHLNIIALVP